MARRRFFVPQVMRGVAELTGDDAEHLVRVLRAEAGQIYEISDNEDLYLARITVARKSIVSFEVMEKLPVPAATGRITLLPALFKFDHFEWLVEKATELGVDEICPFEAVRTERGLRQASVKRRTRWERIVLEASQQSRRVKLPAVAETTSFEQAIQSPIPIRLFLDEDAAAPPILQQPLEQGHAGILLGPEGGWTDEERSQALAAGWKPCSLGPSILRAETAGIAGLAILTAKMRTG
jgi:16S rRNA (uracil1498-N3)-methyltransferase